MPKLSEVIKTLTIIQQKHGDIEVRGNADPEGGPSSRFVGAEYNEEYNCLILELEWDSFWMEERQAPGDLEY